MDLLSRSLMSNKQRKVKTSGKETLLDLSRVRKIFVAVRNAMTYFGEKIKPQSFDGLLFHRTVFKVTS